MVESDFYIVGGGPAGIAAAYFLSQKGFKVEVFEAKKVLGKKPCGGGVPDEINKLIPLQPRSILQEVYGMEIYYEDNLIGMWETNRPIFYVIDRTIYLESLVKDLDIVVNKNSPVKISNNVFISKKGRLDPNKVIVATGVSWRLRERDMVAQTLQYVLDDVKLDNPHHMKFLFYRDLVGYAWIFPLGEKKVEVGIGSLNKSLGYMEERLREIIKRNNFNEGKVEKREGAPIDMGGLKPDWGGNGPYVVGEAIGAVMPLTGEGIRPSIITSSLLAHSIERGSDYVKTLKNSDLFKATKLQRKILEKVYKNGVSIPLEGVQLEPRTVELIYRLGMGKMDLKTLFHIARKLPSLFMGLI
ncbi:hypothetical protein EYM_07560 [Ignicoccus islandicus DSM 13165]|uniref:Digeranylgeranylglycerophospholipid reductase catalytic domain-containing protein n=1 Tax=Ignicoccus islandicus DSM 13165 TaxID=940295 RepID=A0A0U3EEA3_9CREN|nr:NAD(P)/FAD-dependent oxidoreductase [Ignicoccus islandicus]ALU12787.1 hypothetical protein EYM_07560 [Ignicoccus islandicus DSM 13165]